MIENPNTDDFSICDNCKKKYLKADDDTGKPPRYCNECWHIIIAKANSFVREMKGR